MRVVLTLTNTQLRNVGLCSHKACRWMSEMATSTLSHNKQPTHLLSQWKNTVVHPYSSLSAGTDIDRCIQGEKPGHLSHLLHAQISFLPQATYGVKTTAEAVRAACRWRGCYGKGQTWRLINYHHACNPSSPYMHSILSTLFWVLALPTKLTK